MRGYRAIRIDLERIKKFYKDRRVLDEAQIEDYEDLNWLVSKYNSVMEKAPTDLHDLYVYTYIKGMSPDIVNLYKWNVSQRELERLYSRLLGYLRKAL